MLYRSTRDSLAMDDPAFRLGNYVIREDYRLIEGDDTLRAVGSLEHCRAYAKPNRHIERWITCSVDRHPFSRQLEQTNMGIVEEF